MKRNIHFISINTFGEQEDYEYTPENLTYEWEHGGDLPGVNDTILCCIFAGEHLYFETFKELLFAFTGRI